MSNESRAPGRPADSASVSGASADGGDKQQLRLTQILTELQKSGSVSVEGLSRELDVSLVTQFDAIQRRIAPASKPN